MSAPQWKPGDVVLVGDRVKIAGEDGYWYDREGKSPTPWRPTPGRVRYNNVRPLVVIDPENREQVERLTGLIYDAATDRPYVGGAADGVQLALRSLVTPPKPDEPQGLGAVVLDAAGTKWLRHDSTEIHKRWLNTDDCDVRYRAWDEIEAVRVLSEGWSA